MEFLGSLAFRQWAMHFLTVLFFIGGLVGLAAGASLIFNSARTLQFFNSLNRWVSMRSASKPLEIPRDTTQAVQKYRRWLAVFFITGAVFSLYVLSMKFDARAAISALNLHTLRPPVADWLVESIRWILIVGNLAAIGVGILLGFFPVKLAAVESRGGNWYSERKIVKGSDNMHLTLDNWVATFPRTTGVIFTLTTLILIGNFGFTLFGVR